jgi:hypothetical protein
VVGVRLSDRVAGNPATVRMSRHTIEEV